MVNKRLFALFVAVFLLALPAFAQITATLTGTATSDNAPLPGATVTISSPAMQGTRTDVTGPNGDYNFSALPPGTYTVVFELSGLQTVKKTVEVRLAQVARADADLKPSKVQESITVTASAPSVLETPSVSTSLTREQVEALPLGRTIAQRIQLAPGVNNDGPNNQTIIAGAPSYDNLYMVNGVVVNDTIRGQPENLFIEDAIQETTLLTSGVSAEYGRFTGGVVNTITKSGGNEFTGTLRDTITNPSWTKVTSFHDPITLVAQPENTHTFNKQYEATLGGFAIRDRLWFFGAGRKLTSASSRVTTSTNIPFNNIQDNKRYEAKLTGQITSKHSLVASYLHNNTDETNNVFGNIVDLASLSNRQLPNWLETAHYSGVITNSLLVEGQWSRRYFAFVGGGGPKGVLNSDGTAPASDPTFIAGTLMRDIGTGNRAWSPTFCSCDPKTRNNKDYEGKVNYFLSTPSMGSHNIVAGYDAYHEIRHENNFQSGNDFRIFGDFITVGQNIFFHTDPSGGKTTRGFILWTPINELSRTSDAETKSVFLNDKWDFNNHLSFNIGARYDKNNAVDQSHNKVSDDSNMSPRLGIVYDLRGDGRHRFTANYAKYVSHIDNGVNDSIAAGGQPASIYFNYRGPELNPSSQCSATNSAGCVPTATVIQKVFEWFNSAGGVNSNDVQGAFIPGLTAKLQGGLKSPNAQEYTFGYGHQFGSSAFVRADVIHRTWRDFYVSFTNASTGSAVAGTTPVDVSVISNSNQNLSRNYNGLQLQGQYRLGKANLGANWTYSRLRGNAEGETFNNATVTVGNENYPEYKKFAQNNPVGYLAEDIRQRVNLYGNYDVPLAWGSLNLGVIERYHTAANFGSVGTIRVGPSSTFACLDSSLAQCGVGSIANTVGYKLPPTNVSYFFRPRGSIRLDPITETNVSATWNLPSWGKANAFVRFDVQNLFNQQGVEFAATNLGAVVENRIYTRATPPRGTLVAGTNRPNCVKPTGSTATIAANCANPFAGFNPYTDTPKEYKPGMDPNAVYNYELDPNYGKPTNKDAYQLPQTYRFAIGLRF
jgi:outer membrane receptor protein involved in Fe transport